MSSAGESDDRDGGSSRAYAYESAHTLAWVATFGLILEVATSSMAWILFRMEQSFSWGDRAAAGETAAIIFAGAFAAITLAVVVVNIAAIVIFLIWLHRASRNAWALYPEGIKSTPAMAVGCWFIPFVNLIRPYGVVKGLYSGAASDGEALRGDWVRRTREIFPIWWGAWLVQNALSNMAARRGFSDDPEKLETAVWLELAALPPDLVAAVCLAAIIWSIQARQEDLARRTEAATRSGFIAPAVAATDDRDDDETEDEDPSSSRR